MTGAEYLAWLDRMPQSTCVHRNPKGHCRECAAALRAAASGDAPLTDADFRGALSYQDLAAVLEQQVRAVEPALAYISTYFVTQPMVVVYAVTHTPELFAREFELDDDGTVTLVGERQAVQLQTTFEPTFVAGTSSDPNSSYGAPLAKLRADRSAAASRDAARLSRAVAFRAEVDGMRMRMPSPEPQTDDVFLNPPDSYKLALQARRNAQARR